MTGPAPASVSPRAEWLSPDALTDPGAQFAVEWQVVEGIQWYAGPQPAEARHLS